MSEEQEEDDRGKVIVTGTGRSGTSFLMQILTACHLPTGYDNPFTDWYMRNLGGMDRNLHTKMTPDEVAELPKIVKDPRACRRLESLVEGGVIYPEHVIICIRDVEASARSFVSAKNIWIADDPDDPDSFRLGSADKCDVDEQQVKQWLERVLGRLFVTLATHEIPYTTVAFPRMIHDADYLYDKLSEVPGMMSAINRDGFVKVHGRFANPRHVHFGG